AHHTNSSLFSRRAAECRRPPTFTPRVPPDQVRPSLQSIRTRLGDSSAELRGQAEITQAGPGEPHPTGGPTLNPRISRSTCDPTPNQKRPDAKPRPKTAPDGIPDAQMKPEARALRYKDTP